MMNRLGIMAGGLVMLGAALAGCSASVIQGGPLSSEIDPGSHFTQCIDMKRGDVVVDGFNTIPNSSSQVAVIDKVAFADPVRLRQIAAYIIPDSGELYGDWTGYPPNGSHHPANPHLDWSARQNAAGARIPPTPGGGPPKGPNVQLMVVAQSSGDKASEQGINVWYHVGSQHYHLRTPVTMIAVVDGTGQTC
jgi:hypothetical protein